MEGFHLFQEKIKGEVKAIKPSNPHIIFLQSESLSGWDISELGVSQLAHRELKYLQPFDCEIEDVEYELAPFLNFSIEYSTFYHKMGVQIEDGREVLLNFNNDLGMEGKHTIMMFYD